MERWGVTAAGGDWDREFGEDDNPRAERRDTERLAESWELAMAKEEEETRYNQGRKMQSIVSGDPQFS